MAGVRRISGARILDGCGSGWFTEILRNAAEVVGVDLFMIDAAWQVIGSRKMLTRAGIDFSLPFVRLLDYI
jgi:2-polyprenyl-3-methyl-5-hydroxy-6-metoxy-1,4-benzoquinol methylase